MRDSAVAARKGQSDPVPSSRVTRECRSPGLRFSPLNISRLCCLKDAFLVVGIPCQIYTHVP